VLWCIISLCVPGSQTTFELEKRKVTIRSEVYAGVVHFISCIFILPVVCGQLGKAGYNRYNACVITSTCMCLGSIFSGIISNLPFVLSPAASIFIYLSFALRQQGYGELEGNQAVAIAGFCSFALFFRPVLRFLVKLIPQCIQVSTAIGIGLITALAGCLNVNLIVQGNNSIADLGPIDAREFIILLTVLAKHQLSI
jgi:AGZA family xanthine/uracil permease-like MFS transporter